MEMQAHSVIPSSSEPAQSHVGALLRINAAVGSKLSLGSVLETILEASMNEVSAQEGSILLHDGNLERLDMLASRGLPQEIAVRGYIPRKGSIAEWVIENDEPLILNGTVKEARYESGPGRRHIVSSMCLPLHADDQVIGTLNLNRTDASLGVFQEDDLRIMTLIAGYAAASIEKSRLHEAVLHSERLAAIGQTVAGVAHCIKNMLTSLNGGLAICRIAADNGDLETFKEGKGLLERAVNRVSSLALDMLEYSKDREPELGAVSVGDLFNELMTLKSPAATKCDVILSAETGPGVTTVPADSTQLFRCLLNLLENAIDACHAGGNVTLSAELDDSPGARRRLTRNAPAAVVLKVTDDGPGIPPGIATRIFDPFFSTKGNKGTGLGLAVTRKIIREHGGEIELLSAPEGGTVFAIFLPADPDGIHSEAASGHQGGARP